MKSYFFKTDFVSKRSGLHVVSILDQYNIPYSSKNYWKFNSLEPFIDLKNNAVAVSKSTNNVITDYGIKVDTTVGNGVDLGIKDDINQTFVFKFKATKGSGVTILSGTLPQASADTTGWGIFSPNLDGGLSLRVFTERLDGTFVGITRDVGVIEDGVDIVVGVTITEKTFTVCTRVGDTATDYSFDLSYNYTSNSHNIWLGTERYVSSVNNKNVEFSDVLYFNKALSIEQLKEVINAV